MTGRQSMSSDHTGGLYSTDAEHGFRALRQEIVCMRQQPLRLAVAAARAAGRRLALTGGPERRPAPRLPRPSAIPGREEISKAFVAAQSRSCRL